MLWRNPFIGKSKQEALNRYKRELLEQKYRQGYEKHPVSAEEFPVWEEEQLFTNVKKKETFCTQALSGGLGGDWCYKTRGLSGIVPLNGYLGFLKKDLL